MHNREQLGVGRRPKGSGRLRRDEILAAAEALFLKEGYEGATIRKIAAAVGISSTSLYHHFQDKSDLLIEIASRAISELMQVNQAYTRCASPPEDRIRGMLDAYMQFALAHAHSYQLVFGQPLPLADEKLIDVRSLGEQCFELFEHAVSELANTGRLRGDPMIAAQVAWATAHGIVSLQINHPAFPWAAPPKQLSTATLDYLFHGLLDDPRSEEDESGHS